MLMTQDAPLPRSRWLRVPRRLWAVLLAVAMVSGCNGYNYEWWHDLAQCDDAGDEVRRPPRPPANATSECIVLVSGGAQTAMAGFIEHSVILGEPFQAGSVATGGPVELRHGFLPPIPPGWPVGIAQAAIPQHRK
jgi:hypothetical protein